MAKRRGAAVRTAGRNVVGMPWPGRQQKRLCAIPPPQTVRPSRAAPAQLLLLHLKKCTPRLLMPSTSLAGSRPMGSSMRFTVKNVDEPYGSVRRMRRNWERASSLLNSASALYLGLRMEGT